MHELGMCASIVDAVTQRAAGRRVTRVRVRVGALHRVVGEALDQAFSLASEGTVADGATVDLVVVPVRLRCRDCAAESTADDFLAVCPACGGADLEAEGGDELVLESIQLAG